MFQVEICFKQLEICKSVCMFIVHVIICGDWLTIGCFVPMIADHNLAKKSFGPMIADYDLVKKRQTINGCWGKHAHIPNNDYWGICLFHVVWTIFLCAIILMWYTRNIYIYIFINWTLRMSDNLPERVQILSRAYHLHYCTGKQNYLLSNILRFALKICFWADL